MATYRTSAAGGGTTGTSDRTASITPAVGDLLVVFCNASGNTNSAPTCTDDNGGTYDRIGTALKNASADIMSVFVRRSLMTNTSSTTVTVATGSNTAAEIVIVALSSMTRVGSNAVRQSNFQANQAASGTPTPVFSVAALTGNLTLCACANGTAAGSVAVPNASWTERQDVAQSTPTTGLEVNSRDSGFTGTSIAFGGTSATAFASVALEFDTTVPLHFMSGTKCETPNPPPTRSITNLGFVAASMILAALGTLAPPLVQQNTVSVNPVVRKYAAQPATDPVNLLTSTLAKEHRRRPWPTTYLPPKAAYKQIEHGRNLPIMSSEGASPFANLHWPNPPGLRYAQVEPPNNLLGTTLAPIISVDVVFRAPLFVPRQPTAPPRQHAPPNLLGTTLATAEEAKPFAQFDWAVPTKLARNGVDPIGNLLVTTLATPFAQLDWPNPPQRIRGIGAERPPNLFLTTLVGREVLPFRTLDWPNPNQPWKLRTVDPPNLLVATLAVPGRQLDWPNPRGLRAQQPERPPNLVTTTLVGQEILPFRQRDWPNPIPAWRLKVVEPPNLLVTTLAVPGRQLDWPNPRSSSRQQPEPPPNLFVTTLVGQEVLPFRQTAWPVSPAKPTQQPDFSRDGFIPNLFGQETLPFRATDWQNPLVKSAARLADAPPNLSITTLEGQEVLPFRKSDWPNPQVAWKLYFDFPPNLAVTTLATPTQQLDWPNPLVALPRQSQIPPNLLAGTFSIVYDPFRQTDWQNPLLRVSRPAVEAPPNLLDTTLVGQEVLPFRKSDWPNPQIAWKLYFDFPPNLAVTTLATPTRQLDWPNPLVALPRQSQIPPNVLAGTLSIVYDPFVPIAWPNPIRARVNGLDAPNNLLVTTLAVPSQQLDWPNPRGRVAQQPAPANNLLVSTLLGQEVLPFRNEWANPASAKRSVASISQPPNLLSTTLAVTRAPFAPLDWPNPHVKALSFVPTDWVVDVARVLFDTPPGSIDSTLETNNPPQTVAATFPGVADSGGRGIGPPERRPLGRIQFILESAQVQTAKGKAKLEVASKGAKTGIVLSKTASSAVPKSLAVAAGSLAAGQSSVMQATMSLNGRILSDQNGVPMTSLSASGQGQSARGYAQMRMVARGASGQAWFSASAHAVLFGNPKVAIVHEEKTPTYDGDEMPDPI